MANLTVTDVQGLDFVFDGEPFMYVAIESGVSLLTLDYVFDGEGLIGADFSSSLIEADAAQTAPRVQQSLDVDVTVQCSIAQTAPKVTQTLDGYIDVPNESDIAQTAPRVQQSLIAIAEERELDGAQTAPKAQQSIDVDVWVQVDAAQTIAPAQQSLSVSLETEADLAQVTPKAQQALTATLVGQVDAKDTVFLSIVGVADAKDTVLVHTIPNSFSPVLNYAHVSNAFKPSFKFGGVVFNENAATSPAGGLAGYTDFLPHFDLNAIGDIGDCEKLIDWGFTFGFDGGRWFIETLESELPGTTFFGLEGTMNSPSWEYKGGRKVYRFDGFFGSARLDRPIQLFTRTYTYRGNSGKFLTDVFLQSLTLKKWNTIAEAAKAIALIADIDLAWIAPDAPLFEMYLESGMTVRGAIQGLAQRVKADLIWTGTQYLVARQDTTIGAWSVPHCKLITNPFKYKEYIDLRAYENLLYPTEPPGGGESDVAVLPLLNRKPVPVQTIGGLGTKLTDKDPAAKFPLEPGYDQLKARFVTNTATNGTGVITQQQVEQLEANGQGHNAWFGLTGGSLYTNDRGQKFIKIDHTNFPTDNDDINSGRFRLEVGYTPKLDPLRAIIDADRDIVLAQSLANERARLEGFKSILESEAYIGCTFFGSFPMPGVKVTASLGDDTIIGRCFQVSLNKPGDLAIGMANFKILNFYQPLSGVTVVSASAT